MNGKRKSIFKKIFKALCSEKGQALAWMAFIMTTVLGLSGVAVDTGRCYFYYRQLQASSDASALAAAQSLPSTSATTVASTYGAVSGGINTISGLTVTMSQGFPALKCLTTLKNEGMACSAPANANAITVKQTAIVPMYFVGMMGVKTITISASATAAMRGASPSPYNVVVLLDTTQSMNDTDSDSQCSTTRIACALSGIQVLLNSLSPCAATLSTCGSATSGAVADSVDRVSLFVFPNVELGTVGDEYDCKSTNPTPVVYTFPSTSATTYAPTGSTTGTYEALGFDSDYRSSDTSTTLASSSNLVEAVGGKSGCTSLSAEGGEGTYYAGAVYAAQAALTAEQAANPGSQNVLIIVSDGDATSTQSQLASTATSSGLYPSYVDECGQAITAAKAATAAGTHVYTVAYGAEASGCTTDTTGTYKGVTPCQTMENMASAPQYFFSDYTATGGTSSCVSASQPTTNLNQIFTQIAADLTVARLIPDSTT